MRQSNLVTMGLVVCLLIFALAVGCAAPPTVEKTVTVAQETTFAMLDPAAAGKVRAEPDITTHIYDYLARFDEKMDVHPELAEKWEVSPDGLSWTFHLRKNVKFHDGTPFNAAAVKFTFDRLVDPKMAFLNRGLFAPVIKSVDVIDDYTVRFVTTVPFGPLLNYLAHHSAGIVSPAAVQKWGKDFPQHPVGTGAFALQELTPGEKVVLVKNKDYFKGAPKIDKLIFRPVPEDGTRSAMLETGEADIATAIGAADVARLKANPKLNVIVRQSLQAQYIGFNVLHPPFDGPKVRQAFNYAIDKKGIVDTLFQGLFQVSDSVLTPGTFGYKSQGAYPYDPDKAKQLLAEAGWKPGPTGVLEKAGKPLKIVLWMPEKLYPSDVRLGEVVQAQLRKIGVEVSLVKQEAGAYFSLLKVPADKATYDLFEWAFVPSTGDGYQTLQNNILSDKTDVPGYFNYMRYKNPKVDELISLIGSTTNKEERLKHFAAVQEILWKDAPYIYLYTIAITTGVNRNVEGVAVTPFRYVYLTNATKK
ncbi:MAG: ABC transporter substrate-binding protein [Chloroflexi bacterium]|nr:ABC transporter substrate-binding protein [Chloroflexota bacterium]